LPSFSGCDFYSSIAGRRFYKKINSKIKRVLVQRAKADVAERFYNRSDEAIEILLLRN
jgi:hypothetical protein